LALFSKLSPSSSPSDLSTAKKLIIENFNKAITEDHDIGKFLDAFPLVGKVVGCFVCLPDALLFRVVGDFAQS
jgi:hypothetical protein